MSAETAERTVSINGTTIYYRESVTPGEGTPLHTVLYIHGNLGSSRWFSRCMDIEGARMLAMDMPNFGRSDRVDAHDMATYGRFVTAFIMEVAARPVVLVGHSLGGSVAMDVACTSPELVERLLLVDSAPVEGLVTPPEHYPVIDAYREDEARLRQALRMVVPTLTDEVWFDELVADARLMKDDAYVGHAEELGKADYREVADHYHGPVLVIRGGQDLLITDEMAKETARAFGGRFEEFPSVGHSIMVEAPVLFSSIVTRFLTAT